MDHLPSLDPDAGHRADHVRVLNSDVGYGSLRVALAEPSDADPMTWPAVHVLHHDVGAACLDGYAVVTCGTNHAPIKQFNHLPFVSFFSVPFSLPVLIFRITTSQVGIMDGDADGVLEMDSVSVGTVSRGRDGDTEDLNIMAAVELEMALRRVLNRDAGHRYIGAPIEPHGLIYDIRAKKSFDDGSSISIIKKLRYESGELLPTV